MKFETFLAQRQLKGGNRGVQLSRETDRIEAESRERVMRRPEDRFDVIDDLHGPRIQRRRARSFRHNGHIGAVATGGERGAVAGNAAADDQDFRQRETMRRVSATSCLSWRTRSLGVGNLMSGCR